jgi:hypothetical protein
MSFMVLISPTTGWQLNKSRGDSYFDEARHELYLNTKIVIKFLEILILKEEKNSRYSQI